VFMWVEQNVGENNMKQLMRLNDTKHLICTHDEELWVD